MTKFKFIFIHIFFITLPDLLPAQVKVSKSPIDTSVLGKFPKVTDGNISPDGRFVSYLSAGPSSGSVIILDTKSAWQRVIKGNSFFRSAMFTAYGKAALLQKADTLCFIQLGDEQDRDHTLLINSCKISDDGRWVAWQEKGGQEAFVVKDMLNDREQQFSDVISFEFDESYKHVLLTQKKDDGRKFLRLVDLSNYNPQQIWEGEAAEDPVNATFNEQGTELAFLVNNSKEKDKRSELWLLTSGDEKAQRSSVTENLQQDMILEGIKGFTQNGNWLLLSLTPPPLQPLPSKDPKAVDVEVWSYKDSLLQSQQLARRNDSPEPIMAWLGIKSGQLRIQPTNSAWTRPGEVVTDQVVINQPDRTKIREFVWNALEYPQASYIWTLSSGSRRPITSVDVGYSCFSPDGCWFVYYDLRNGAYFSVESVNGKTRKISNSNYTSEPLGDRHSYIHHHPNDPSPGWLKDGRILVYDQYDLWAMDPAGLKAAENLTRGYGRKSHLRLRLLDGARSNRPANTVIYASGDTLLLYIVNEGTQYNGFVKLVLGAPKDPEILTLGPYSYFRSQDSYNLPGAFGGMTPPLKAADVNRWLVKRESATEAPNYFISDDLVHFKQVTNLQPQAGYNWLTSEIVHWTLPEGSLGQGILYKPEDFDPKKKYPVICWYYQLLSDRCYKFLYPEWSGDNINIPWLVSRGYLVFLPDIHYKIAALSNKVAAEFAYDAVVSGVKELIKWPYVDGLHIGLQGSSFGAYETNYIIAHSHLFAAAFSSSGPTDEFSEYLQLTAGGYETQTHAEVGQGRIGATPWQRPDLYRKASPVWDADKVTTPLLLMANRQDRQVPYEQGVEYYMALRRLGKPVWMLMYDKGGHGISGAKAEARDLTIRATQFFDYYLKGTPPPVWMTQGIPGRLKGLVTGYELDTSGRKPWIK